MQNGGSQMKGLFAFEAEPFEFEAYGGSESEFTFRPEPFPPPSESEWEGEANRSSPDYIRWAQSSLNRVMGLRLAVDGILGPATRSAVRNFQQRQGTDSRRDRWAADRSQVEDAHRHAIVG